MRRPLQRHPMSPPCAQVSALSTTASGFSPETSSVSVAMSSPAHEHPLGAHRGQERQERCFRSGGYAREQASRHFKVVGKLWCLNRRVLASSLRPTWLEFKIVMCNHEVEPLQGKCLPRRMRRRPRTLLAGHAWVVQLVLGSPQGKVVGALGTGAPRQSEVVVAPFAPIGGGNFIKTDNFSRHAGDSSRSQQLLPQVSQTATKRTESQ